MITGCRFSSAAPRPLLLCFLLPMLPAQGAYSRAGGAGPECRYPGLILASISLPLNRSHFGGSGAVQRRRCLKTDVQRRTASLQYCGLFYTGVFSDCWFAALRRV